MLGELIYEHKGKITGQKVLDINEEGLPKIEVSLSANGNFKKEGIEVTETVKYWSIPKPGGALDGQW
jgi:hypothetical protein